MNTKNIGLRIGIGLGLGIIAYFVVKYVAKNKYAIAKPKNKSFVNADGKESSYTAQRYEPTYESEDGSLGATWIAYNTNPLIGYWEKGQIDVGTPMFP